MGAMNFKDRLNKAWKQGEFAHAFAKLIVNNDVRDFAFITTQPDFDIAVVYDEKLVEEHIEHRRKHQR